MSFQAPTDWVDAETVADYLGITLQTLGRWIPAYGLPCHQISRRGRRYFKLAEVDAWLASREAVA